VANAFDSDIDTVCTQTSANGNISINYGTNNPIYIGSIGILPAASGSATVIYEYSYDGSTWETLYSPGAEVWVDNEWIWHDIDPGVTAQYYRIRATGGTTLSLRELFFGNNSTEITMARLNRDDYTNLPNKNFTANQPFQYWFDRTIPQPSMYLWPVPSDTFVQMTVWYSRQIEDVGALTNEIAIPGRWYEAVLDDALSPDGFGVARCRCCKDSVPRATGRKSTCIKPSKKSATSRLFTLRRTLASTQDNADLS
jgi:hypothetical protein